jgi:hypothetical protein
VTENSRRLFLKSAAGLTLAGQAAAAPAPLLPTVRFGRHEVTRLIIGTNPFCGYSHFNPLLDQFMREYMTPDRVQEILVRCEQAGINTWQLHYQDKTMAFLKRYRAEGGKMNIFLLSDFELQKNPRQLLPEAAKLGPIGIAHHGNRTDDAFHAGKMNQVREFLKMVRDTGVMVGVSTHNPAVVDYCEGQDWDVDYYQTCFYQQSRLPEDQREHFREAVVGEPFFEGDPERMCKMIRQTRKPCLGFKILAAGRRVKTSAQVEEAFRFAYQNIKPSDCVIVGMCPRFKDEVREDTELARRYAGRANA